MRYAAVLMTALFLTASSCGDGDPAAPKRTRAKAAKAPSAKAAEQRLQAIIDDLHALIDRLPDHNVGRAGGIRVARRIAQGFRRGQNRVYAVPVPKDAEFAKSSLQDCLAAAADHFDGIADDLGYRDRYALRTDVKMVKWDDQACELAAAGLRSKGIKIRLAAPARQGSA